MILRSNDGRSAMITIRPVPAPRRAEVGRSKLGCTARYGGSLPRGPTTSEKHRLLDQNWPSTAQLRRNVCLGGDYSIPPTCAVRRYVFKRGPIVRVVSLCVVASTMIVMPTIIMPMIVITHLRDISGFRCGRFTGCGDTGRDAAGLVLTYRSTLTDSGPSQASVAESSVALPPEI